MEREVFHQPHQVEGEEGPKDTVAVEIRSHEEFQLIPTPWPGVLHYYRCKYFQISLELGWAMLSG